MKIFKKEILRRIETEFSWLKNESAFYDYLSDFEVIYNFFTFLNYELMIEVSNKSYNVNLSRLYPIGETFRQSIFSVVTL